MLLSDMGAEVIRVDRVQPAALGIPRDPRYDFLNRGRKSIAMDLKKAEAVEALLKMVEQADALIEGFRPGVMEKLGLGPDVCLERNPRLVYGRMTGWGQEGPLSHAAGHDINYIALTGALHCIGRAGGPPVPPLNLVGDYGGGGLYLAFGVVCGMLEASRSGKGQVIDAAMVDGAASLMTTFYSLRAMGYWTENRGENILDSGAHFYDVYETADGKYIAVGAIEEKFYRELLQRIGLEEEGLPNQMDRSRWPEMHERLQAIFKTKTRRQWCEILEGTDACFAPVLSLDEAPRHPHNVERGTFVEVDGLLQPGPAPRFSRTVPEVQGPPAVAGQHTDEILAGWGFSQEQIRQLHEAGAVHQAAAP
jgi:alpha-methylacyl-CoA racemase